MGTKMAPVGDTISVDPYTKLIDTHQYFLPTLSPKTRQQKCSDNFESRTRELTEHLCKRGYQKKPVSPTNERAWQQKREEYFLIGLNLSPAFSPSC